ncbi:MAG TPA: hypothetical protein VMF91_15240 [Bryobacteraceae bacterium]|nr:hypothetical protein [Bryobacteraceae bacterium]
MSTLRQQIANMANAQRSTGPVTPQGKAASSMNNLKFGLTGNCFGVLAWEKQEEYEAMRNGLIAEHRPSTPTEHLLIEKMAQHHWLSLRATLLQEMCFNQEYPDCDQDKKLALYLRYQTTHERAFYKALNELAKLRVERRKSENGFESQKHKEAAETRKQQMHEARIQFINARTATHAGRISSYVPPPMNQPVEEIPLEKAHREAA